MVWRPPMPEPIMTPVASRSSSVSGFQPLSSTASCAATKASWMKRSIFFWSLTGIHSPRSRPPSARVPSGTWPAILAGRSFGSKNRMAEMPLSPAISRGQTWPTPTPSGQAMPMPVTTTRRGAALCANTLAASVLSRSLLRRSGGLLAFDVVDRVLDRGDLLGGVVRDLHAERLLERHHQLHRVQAVGAEVVDEGRLRGHLAFVHAEVLDDDLLDLLGGVAHRVPVSCLRRCIWGRPGPWGTLG